MGQKKLLIANSNEDFLLAMAQILEQRCQVVLCQDGKSALELLRREGFDLILLDLMLPELDGLSLLEQAQAEGCCPPALALTPLLNPYVEQSAQRLGIRYLVRPPCDLHSLARRTEELMLPDPVPVPLDDRQYLSGLLLALPLSPRVDGYRFLVECSLRFSVRPDQGFTKELYPAVGKRSGHTGSQVERSIRSALDAAWKVRSDDQWQQLFHCGEKRPSASQAIARLAEQLRQRESNGRG